MSVGNFFDLMINIKSIKYAHSKTKKFDKDKSELIGLTQKMSSNQINCEHSQSKKSNLMVNNNFIAEKQTADIAPIFANCVFNRTEARIHDALIYADLGCKSRKAVKQFADAYFKP